MRPSHRVAGRAAVAASIIVAGCLGETPPSSSEQTARQQWDNSAWPALATCAGCHGSQPAIDFLAPNTSDGAYTNVFAFQPPVIDVEVPAASLLLTMGKHTGPAFTADQASAVLAWLEAEHDERMPASGQTVRIGPFLPTPGTALTLDLQIGGATLTLLPETSDAGLYFSHLTIHAGTGIHLAHPLFVSRPPKPLLDELDRFSTLDMKLAAGAQVELGPEWFLDFSSADYLSVHFSTLEAP
jgi:mono/diheme cytochrome c family protein